MADVAIDDKAENPVTESPAPEGKTFTQDDLDRIVSREKAKLKAAYDREREDAAKKEAEAQEVARLEGEAKLRKEWEIRERELTAARDKAEHDLAVSNVRAKLAEMGYSEVADIAPSLIGEDGDATDANVAAFAKMVRSLVSAEVSRSLASGAPADPSAGNRPDASADLREQMRHAAGLR